MTTLIALMSGFALAEEPTETPAEAAPAEAPAAPEPRTWKLDPSASTLFVLVKHDPNTALSGLAHDHTVAATGWSGTVTWTEGDPSACKVEITVPVSGLVIDPPGLRQRAGLEGDTPDSDKAKISDNMWGSRQLEKDVFPSISFASTSCNGSGSVITVAGNMTIHGVTKAVSLPMTINVSGDTFSAKGTMPSTASAWGFQPFTAAFGAIKNLDELQFTIDVRGR
ncbi:MAG: YceI family protein [Alphaproteobacteria bacterium]|nr:YceI family protein [Alphaproteobacteria bacterium]MCB9698918.1 YceI family protein [Alphaproteobacteria bacterium]